jgi:hypothetical protein
MHLQHAAWQYLLQTLPLPLTLLQSVKFPSFALSSVRQPTMPHYDQLFTDCVFYQAVSFLQSETMLTIYVLIPISWHLYLFTTCLSS